MGMFKKLFHRKKTDPAQAGNDVGSNSQNGHPNVQTQGGVGAHAQHGSQPNAARSNVDTRGGFGPYSQQSAAPPTHTPQQPHPNSSLTLLQQQQQHQKQQQHHSGLAAQQSGGAAAQNRMPPVQSFGAPPPPVSAYGAPPEGGASVPQGSTTFIADLQEEASFVDDYIPMDGDDFAMDIPMDIPAPPPSPPAEPQSIVQTLSDHTARDEVRPVKSSGSTWAVNTGASRDTRTHTHTHPFNPHSFPASSNSTLPYTQDETSLRPPPASKPAVPMPKPAVSEVSSTVVCDLGELEARSPLVQEMHRQVLKEELRSGKLKNGNLMVSKKGGGGGLAAEAAQRRYQSSMNSAASAAAPGFSRTPSEHSMIAHSRTHSGDQDVLGGQVHVPISPLVKQNKHGWGNDARLDSIHDFPQQQTDLKDRPVSKWSDPLRGRSQPLQPLTKTSSAENAGGSSVYGRSTYGGNASSTTNTSNNAFTTSERSSNATNFRVPSVSNASSSSREHKMMPPTQQPDIKTALPQATQQAVIKIADLQMDETPSESPSTSLNESPDKSTPPNAQYGSKWGGHNNGNNGNFGYTNGSGSNSSDNSNGYYPQVDGNSVASDAPTAISARGWSAEQDVLSQSQVPYGYDNYGQASSGDWLQAPDLGLQDYEGLASPPHQLVSPPDSQTLASLMAAEQAHLQEQLDAQQAAADVELARRQAEAAAATAAAQAAKDEQEAAAAAAAAERESVVAAAAEEQRMMMQLQFEQQQQEQFEQQQQQQFEESQQAAASQSTAVDTHAHGTHAQSAAAESNAGNLGAITGVPVEKVGIPGALMEGGLARLNKKKKDWEDRYCVIVCGQQDVAFAYLLDLYESRESAAAHEEPLEHIHITNSEVSFVQGTVFTIKTSGELNKKGATHFISSETEDEVRGWLSAFELVPDVSVNWVGKDGTELAH